ncbi:uncharacterized protein LOC119285214 isoform X2 [Triticum dicoccoides]|uniref:uncharacterized protein LOC119285214 isoform X2 n=1 Tax=Triticum dicoccoides TaxID=85692 RepID=UPI0018904AE4|nr:uncharacterized protein LOC119285214 isoform X2 [Triticum dicoccoides]
MVGPSPSAAARPSTAKPPPPLHGQASAAVCRLHGRASAAFRHPPILALLRRRSTAGAPSSAAARPSSAAGRRPPPAGPLLRRREREQPPSAPGRCRCASALPPHNVRPLHASHDTQGDLFLQRIPHQFERRGQAYPFPEYGLRTEVKALSINRKFVIGWMLPTTSSSKDIPVAPRHSFRHGYYICLFQASAASMGLTTI